MERGSLYDLGDPLVERIVLLSKEDRNVRIVCKHWRNVIDHSHTPFPLRASIYRRPAALLKTPKDPDASKGCLVWCRRNGKRLISVEVVVSNTWWYLPSAPLRHLCNATRLRIIGNDDLPKLPETQSLQLLSPLTSLQHLDVWFLPVHSNQLQSLSCLTALQHLDFTGCEDIRDLKTIGQLTSLTGLCVEDCGIGMEISDLASLPQLQSLSMAGVVDSIHGVSKLIGLTHFHWREDDLRCKGEQLQELKCLSKLRNLHLCVADFDTFAYLQSSTITSLELWCLGETGSSELTGLPNLRQLCLRSSESVVDLSGLGALKHLRVLDVQETYTIPDDMYQLDAKSLRGLTNLKVLYMASTNVNDTAEALSPLRLAGVKIMFNTTGIPQEQLEGTVPGIF